MQHSDKNEAIRREARRNFKICNSCRYCEGFCAVFPAMMRMREFTDGNLNYLANLCHNCKGCFHACQYAPPHPFGVNLPRTMTRLRTESYAQYAWPRPFGRAFERNGVVVGAISSFTVAAVFVATGWRGLATLTSPHLGPGAFYEVIPWWALSSIGGASFLFSCLALVVSGLTFWRDTGGGPALAPGPVARAAKDALTLRYLGGGHGGADGCNDVGEKFSQMRRFSHHFTFYGFIACFASTTSAEILDRFFQSPAPYRLLSLPVMLGVVGGIGLIVGPAGLLWTKIVTDQKPEARSALGGGYALLGQLMAISVTGLLLLMFRDTAGMGILLAVHLGFVFSFFLLLPYSKMVHGLYRSLALLRHAIERSTSATASME